MSSTSDLKSIIKDLKENFETVKDIATTYQNDIYRQNPDDYDDLKEFIKNVDKNITELNDIVDLIEKANRFKEEKKNRESMVNKTDGFNKNQTPTNYSSSYQQDKNNSYKSSFGGYKKYQSSTGGQNSFKNGYLNKNNENRSRQRPWKQK